MTKDNIINRVKHYSSVPREYVEFIQEERTFLMENATFFGKIFFGIMMTIVWLVAIIIGYGFILPVTAICFKVD
tara:strand:- start:73933 stop:74154 length:222 start_codon:yes stop_codon:yes gene_type:complete